MRVASCRCVMCIASVPRCLGKLSRGHALPPQSSLRVVILQHVKGHIIHTSIRMPTAKYSATSVVTNMQMRQMRQSTSILYLLTCKLTVWSWSCFSNIMTSSPSSCLFLSLFLAHTKCAQTYSSACACASYFTSHLSPESPRNLT